MSKPRVELRNASEGDTLLFSAATNKYEPAPVPAPTVSLTNGDLYTIAARRVVAVAADGKARLASKAGRDPVVGLALQGVATGLPLTVQTSGPLTATAAEWDAVTGDSGGLVVGTRYFLGTAGGLTRVRPTTAGESLCLVGLAMGTTVLLIDVRDPILL